MNQRRKLTAYVGIYFCFIVIIVSVAKTEERVESGEEAEDKIPSITEILGDRVPLVPNTRTAKGGALPYGFLGRHFENDCNSVLKRITLC